VGVSGEYFLSSLLVKVLDTLHYLLPVIEDRHGHVQGLDLLL